MRSVAITRSSIILLDIDLPRLCLWIARNARLPIIVRPTEAFASAIHGDERSGPALDLDRTGFEHQFQPATYRPLSNDFKSVAGFHPESAAPRLDDE